MNKLFYTVLGLVLILIGVSAFLWFSRPTDMTEPDRQTDEKVRRANNANLPESNTPLPEADKTELGKKLGAFFSEEQLANPEVQRMLKIFESPEGQAFLKSERNGLADTFAFLESQGVEVNRNIFTEHYRRVFPTGEPEEFEQEIRQRLVEVVGPIGNEPRNPTELKRFTDIVTEFLEDERNYAWVSGRFQGNNKAFGQWAVQILRNPVSSPVEQMPETVVGENTFELPTDVGALPPDAQDPARPPIDTATLAPELPASERTLPTTETEISELLTEQPKPIEIAGEKVIPELPTEADLEASLGEQFSPERYQKAMATLNRYGPEAGLRRLRSADPEIAKRIEHLLKRKEDTQ